MSFVIENGVNEGPTVDVAPPTVVVTSTVLNMVEVAPPTVVVDTSVSVEVMLLDVSIVSSR